jgi:hypothetical protein
MLYWKNPKNRDKLSVLGFGCMRLAVKEDGYGPFPEFSAGRT